LGSVILALRHEAGGQVADPNGAGHFIYVLSPRSAAAEGFDLEIVLDQIDRDLGIDGDDIDGSEAGLLLAVRIEV
jgi:hypothetical protein